MMIRGADAAEASNSIPTGAFAYAVHASQLQSSSHHSRAGCSLECVEEDRELVLPERGPTGNGHKGGSPLPTSIDSLEGSLYMLDAAGTASSSSGATRFHIVRGLMQPSSPSSMPATLRASPFSGQAFQSPETTDTALTSSSIPLDSAASSGRPDRSSQLSSSLPARGAASALSSELFASLARMSVEDAALQTAPPDDGRPRLFGSADNGWPAISVRIAPVAPPPRLYRSSSATELYHLPEKHVRGGRPFGGSSVQLHEGKMRGGLSSSRGDAGGRSPMSSCGMHSPSNSQHLIPGLKVFTVRTSSYMGGHGSQASDLDGCGALADPGSSSTARRGLMDARLSLDDDCKVHAGLPGSMGGEHKVHGGLTRGSSRSSFLDLGSGTAMNQDRPGSSQSSLNNSLTLASGPLASNSFGLYSAQHPGGEGLNIEDRKWAAMVSLLLEQSPVDSVLGGAAGGSAGFGSPGGVVVRGQRAPESQQSSSDGPWEREPQRERQHVDLDAGDGPPVEEQAGSELAAADAAEQGGTIQPARQVSWGAAGQEAGSPAQPARQVRRGVDGLGAGSHPQSAQQGSQETSTTKTSSHDPLCKSSHDDHTSMSSGQRLGHAGTNSGQLEGSMCRSTPALSCTSDAPTVNAWCMETMGVDFRADEPVTVGVDETYSSHCTVSTGLAAFSSSAALAISRSPSQDASPFSDLARAPFQDTAAPAPAPVVAIEQTPSLGMMWKVRRGSTAQLPSVTSMAGASSGLWASGLDLAGVQALAASSSAARESSGPSQTSNTSIGVLPYSTMIFGEAGPSSRPPARRPSGLKQGCYDLARRPSLLEYAESVAGMVKTSLSCEAGQAARRTGSGFSGLQALG